MDQNGVATVTASCSGTTTWNTTYKVTVKLNKKPGVKGIYIGITDPDVYWLDIIPAER